MYKYLEKKLLQGWQEFFMKFHRFLTNFPKSFSNVENS